MCIVYDAINHVWSNPLPAMQLALSGRYRPVVPDQYTGEIYLEKIKTGRSLNPDNSMWAALAIFLQHEDFIDIHHRVIFIEGNEITIIIPESEMR